MSETITGVVESTSPKEKYTGIKINGAWGNIWNNKMPQGIEKGVNVTCEKTISGEKGQFTNWVNMFVSGGSAAPPAPQAQAYSAAPRQVVPTKPKSINDTPASIMAQCVLKAAVEFEIATKGANATHSTVDKTMEQFVMTLMKHKDDICLYLDGTKKLGDSHTPDVPQWVKEGPDIGDLASIY